MNMAAEPHPKNYLRRAIGVVLCFSPLALLLTSTIAAFAGSERHPFAAVGFIIVALFFAVLNFYLSFIRPWRLLRQHGSLEGIPHVSGFPIIGTILVLLGGVFGFGAIGTALLGIVALAFDTGGAPWFLIATWRDSSLWDSPQ
ncbi:hypothetical protein AGMMS49545_02390 [Betaproteobacteria bacterium]|nr:hypothetical protein AGMMS49545_02390 [Betaproteobacteria bacterium]